MIKVWCRCYILTIWYNLMVGCQMEKCIDSRKFRNWWDLAEPSFYSCETAPFSIFCWPWLIHVWYIQVIFTEGKNKMEQLHSTKLLPSDKSEINFDISYDSIQVIIWWFLNATKMKNKLLAHIFKFSWIGIFSVIVV
jgi:hypothetical protein